MKRRSPRHAVPVPEGERRSLLAWLLGWRPEPDDGPRVFEPQPEPARWLDGDGPDVWLPRPSDYGTGLNNGTWAALPDRDMGDTQPIEGVIVPDDPQPAHAPGLTPAPAPRLPMDVASDETPTQILPAASRAAGAVQIRACDLDPGQRLDDLETWLHDRTTADLEVTKRRFARLDVLILRIPRTGPGGDLPRRIPGASLPPGQQHRGRRPYGALALERRTATGGAR